MLPWFTKWNAENPTNIYIPAIAFGTLGGAILVAAMAVMWGDPFAHDSLQTGPRGTGMQVTRYASAVMAPDPTIADYYTEAPTPPEPGEDLAGAAYQNVQVLGDLTVTNFDRLMTAMTMWVAPDEGCAYCHAGANDGDYASDAAYTKVVARRMIEMTQTINDSWSGHVNAAGQAGVTCYTCHRGQNVPSDVWFRIDPVVEAKAGWSAVQNRATIQSQYTSLPSTALQAYLVDAETIAVHDLESHVNASPTDPEVKTWQDTERTYSLMNYFANSLNVNCVFCHNSRAFFSAQGEVTPQWATAGLGIQMVQELNNEYLLPLAGTLPANRLGPVHGDGPKVACKTCHKGYQRPMQGMDVIGDWPELAAPGAPVYE